MLEFSLTPFLEGDLLLPITSISPSMHDTLSPVCQRITLSLSYSRKLSKGVVFHMYLVVAGATK